LRRRGVVVEAAAIGRNDAERLPPRGEIGRLPKVADYNSPPLREYIKVILKVSHNLYASTMPLLIAAHRGQTTLESGLLREGEILKGLGVDVSTIAFGGGAGGARADLVTPRATVALLRAMAGRADFRAFDAALPILGRDGTLARTVAADSPARGHVRAKTGTYTVGNDLRGKTVLTSKALAGYMETAAGRALVITFFLNNVPLDAASGEVSEATAAAGRALGRLCEAVYGHDAPAESRPRAGDP
jgi:D-alanyl-D-alanine carboxypeptidase/D-alanyl-D-alanine-endopeptidase (penicillin-binding protein 4)